MLAKQFLDLFDQWQPAKYAGLEDFADKLNFLYTPIIITVLTLIVTAKSYILDNIACYSPTVFSGKNYDDYLANYCWMHGTIPLQHNRSTPSKQEEWALLDKTDRISYYQWVPFFLGIQIILFYLPRLFWQVICYNRMGTDLESVVTTANNAMHAKTAEEKEKHINFSVNILASMIYQHRDYSSGKMAQYRRQFYKRCNLLVVSKRLGTWVVVLYLFTKVCYAVNSIMQLVIMRNFLGFGEHLSMWNFGWRLTNQIISGQTWQETMIFPRTAICHGQVRQVGAQNNVFNAICALPVNMVNEKVFIFLWFWCCLVTIVTLLSIPVWFLRVSLSSSHFNFVEKHLRIAGLHQEVDYPTLQKFVVDYLRHDGVFILRMMSLNAGDMVATTVLSKLWTKYKNFHSHSQPETEKELEAMKADPFNRMMAKLYDCSFK